MPQSFLNIFIALMTVLSQIFSWNIQPVPVKSDLPAEAPPVENAYREYDRVDGIDSSSFYIARPKAQVYNTVNALSFGLDVSSWDNYDAFCRAVGYCRNNPNTRLIIDSGTYYFRSDRAILLDGLENILIDADNAAFVFEHDKYFTLADCRCVEINGLTVDWNWSASRLASLVRVENANAAGHTLDFVFTELTDVQADIPFAALTQYDSQSLTPGAMGVCKENYLYQNPQRIVKIEKTENNVLRVTHDGSLDSFAAGETYLLRHYVYGGSVFYVGAKSQNITFDNIKIYSAAGMGFVFAGRSQRFQVVNSYVGLAPGLENSRRVSLTADAIHIADTNGYFRVSGCDLSFMGDDALNVHDNLMYVMDRAASNALQLTNVYLLAAGDRMAFNSPQYEKIDFTAEITAISGSTVYFDKALPDSIDAGCILYSLDCDSSNYVISGNYFHESRARGLLLQSDNGLCENNRFYKTMGQAIKIVMDVNPGLWYEGKGVNNLAVRSNTFELCDYSGWGEVITIGTNIDGKSATVPMFSNITVEDNTFSEMPFYALKAENVAGLDIAGNKIINATKLNSDSKRRGRINIGEICSGVVIERNEWRLSAYAPLGCVVIIADPKPLI